MRRISQPGERHRHQMDLTLSSTSKSKYSLPLGSSDWFLLPPSTWQSCFCGRWPTVTTLNRRPSHILPTLNVPYPSQRKCFWCIPRCCNLLCTLSMYLSRRNSTHHFLRYEHNGMKWGSECLSLGDGVARDTLELMLDLIFQDSARWCDDAGGLGISRLGVASEEDLF